MRLARAGILAAFAALAAACDTARPVEETAQTNDCARCHGYPPPPFVTAQGSSHPDSTDCSQCHPGTVEPDDVTIVPPDQGGLHMNGSVEATAAHADPYPPSAHGPAALANIASCQACHGADYAGGTSGVSCNACHAGEVAASAPDWKTNCTFCHGTRTSGVTTATARSAPPQAVVSGDQTAANPKVGAHQAHLVAGTFAGALPCASCHAVPASGDQTQGSRHFTGGAATLTFSALASKGVTSPSYAGAGGACAVYCHGTGTEFGSPSGKTSPAWTSTAALGCTSCHGAPPASHAPGSTNCRGCHPGTVNASGAIDVAGGLHVNGSVEAATAHAVPYPPSAHGPAALAGIASCQACHGADYAGGTSGVSCNACHAGQVAASAPDWKTNCTFCHGTRTSGVTTATAQSAPPQAVVSGGDQTAANPKVGAHQAHLATGAVALAFPCGSCHAVPASGDQTQGARHFTGGAATLTFDALASKGVTSPSYAGAGGACAVYCHGTGTEFGSPSGKTSPAWTSTAALGCTSCHGFPPTTPHPQDSSCSTCHPGTVNSNGTLNVAGGLHVNGAKDATSPHPANWANPTQHGYSVNASGLSSCKDCHGANLEGGSGQACADCHGAGWDTNCTFCHGDAGRTPTGARSAPPVDTQGRSVTTNVSVGLHVSHVTTTIATPLACTECHPARGQSVITDTAHIDGNGVAEVVLGALARTGGAAATYTRTSATAATCSSVYCHGTFAGGTPTTPSWTSGTVSCTSCHPINPGTGEHPRHAGAGITCAECHAEIGTPPRHLNGTKDVPFSPVPAGASWNSGGNNCGTFTCHPGQPNEQPHGTGDNWR